MVAEVRLIATDAQGSAQNFTYKAGAKHSALSNTKYKLVVDGSEQLPPGTKIHRAGKDLVVEFADGSKFELADWTAVEGSQLSAPGAETLGASGSYASAAEVTSGAASGLGELGASTAAGSGAAGLGAGQIIGGVLAAGAIGAAASGGGGGNNNDSRPAAPSNAPDLVAEDDSSANDDNLTNQGTPRFAVQAPAAGESAVLLVDGVETVAAYDAASGTLRPESALADGAHAIASAVRDAAGRLSAASPTLTVTIDTTIAQPALDVSLNNGIAEVSGTAEPGSTVTITLPDDSTRTVTADENGNYSVLLDPTVPYFGTYSATASDAAGNVATTALAIEPTPASLKIVAYAQSNENPAPELADYSSVEVTGVDASNLAAINSAIDARIGLEVDTTLEVQAIVNAYNAILAEANGAASDSTPDADPAAAVYAAAGANIGAAATDAENLNLLNDALGAQSSGSVDSIAEINALASIVNRIMTTVAGGSAVPALTLADAATLGLTGVTSSNLQPVLAALAAGVDSGITADTLAELQAGVDAYTKILAEANGSSADATSADATAADYFAIGASIGTANTDAEHLALLNDALGASVSTSVDTPAEINALASIVERVMTTATGSNASPALSVADFAKLGVTISTPESLPVMLNLIGESADDGTGVDTVIELQELANQAVSLNILRNYAEANGGAPVPVQNTYDLAGVTGVTNVGAINSALLSQPVAGTDADSVGEVQAIVAAYNAILAEANSFAGDATPAVDPSAAQYAAIGADIGSAASSAQSLSLLNDVIGEKLSAEVDTVADIEALALLVDQVMLEAAGTPSTLTEADFAVLEVSVGAVELPTFLAAIEATADDGSEVDTLLELRALVPTVVPTSAALSLTELLGDAVTSASVASDSAARSGSSASAADPIQLLIDSASQNAST